MTTSTLSITSPLGITLLLLAVLGGFFLWSAKFGGLLPKPLRSRSCQGKNWRSAFPDASKQQIREFLSLFVSAFAYRETEKLKLNPGDSLLQIYRLQYPRSGQGDSLEFETLVEDVSHKYGLDLQAIWREDLTLGELFAHTTAVLPAPPAP
jgi:hypothetical protein